MFDEQAITALARTLVALPRQELRLFELLPQLFRDGEVVHESAIRLGPEIEAAADEATRYAEAVRRYVSSVVTTLRAAVAP
jgi:hypothetical protein